MKFCPDCNNCIYIKENTKDTGERYLENYCRNCGFVEEREETKLDTFKTNQESVRRTYSPEELVHDYTYPRTKAVKCPNPECSETGKGEVMYFRQKNSLKLNYVCCDCNTMWKN